MSTIENKLKTAPFWLRLGVINHSIALTVIAFSYLYSGFKSQGDAMNSVLEIYAFTLFTPQVALEVILLMALFLVNSSTLFNRENYRLISLFLGTLALLAAYAFWR